MSKPYLDPNTVGSVHHSFIDPMESKNSPANLIQQTTNDLGLSILEKTDLVIVQKGAGGQKPLARNRDDRRRKLHSGLDFFYPDSLSAHARQSTDVLRFLQG